MRNSSVSDAHTIKIKNKHILQNIQVNHLSRTNTSNINLLVVESLKIFNKTLQGEVIYVWYIFSIKQIANNSWH